MESLFRLLDIPRVLFGSFGFFNWLTPALKFIFRGNVLSDVARMVTLRPLKSPWHIRVHTGDLPTAIVILQDLGIISNSIFPNFDLMRKISTSPLYPLDPWEMVEVPDRLHDAVISAFEYAGVRYK